MLDHAPNQCVIDQIVPVDQHVAKRDDLDGVADAVRRLLVDLGEPLHCLADDLEVSFYGIPESPVATVVVQRQTLRGLPDKFRRITDIFKKFRRLRLHTRADVSDSRIR